MINSDNIRTKVITSFLAHNLSVELAKSLSNEPTDVLRIVYDDAARTKIKGFLEGLEQHHCASIMIDTSSLSQGLTLVDDAIEVSFGDTLTVSDPKGKGEVKVDCSDLTTVFKEDSSVFFSFGQVVFKARSVEKNLVKLEVTQGGTIRSHMEILVPATSKPLLPDLKKLAPFMELGIDYLVVSGQLSPSEIMNLRAQLDDGFGDRAPWIIAKIDSEDSYERLNEILSVTDGVVISRREIALSTNPATVPMVTKEIIQRCNDKAKLVITASEMLASMRVNVTPTRAEVSDVANAVIDGTDAVIISEEVAEGPHRGSAMRTMLNIIRDVEKNSDERPNWTKFEPLITNEMDAVTYNAILTAQRVGAKAIVTITKAGNTALRLSSHRVPVPIIAVTFSDNVLRRLQLVRGTEVIKLDVDPHLDDVLPVVTERLINDSWLSKGDRIIFVAITLSPVGRDASNLFTVQVL